MTRESRNYTKEQQYQGTTIPRNNNTKGQQYQGTTHQGTTIIINIKKDYYQYLKYIYFQISMIIAKKNSEYATLTSE